MLNLKDKIEDSISGIMEIEKFEIRGNKIVFTGRFVINEESAVDKIQEIASRLKLYAKFEEIEEGVEVIFVPRKEIAESKKWVNILLLAITFFTTLAAGALQQGINPLTDPSKIIQGLPFSLSIMIILGCHELGHYFAALKNDVHATLPYFIPAPHLIGTFGAVIKMKTPIRSRNSLVEIGAAGPIAGFILATIAFIVGLNLSEVVSISGTTGLILGDSLLTRAFTELFYGDLPEGKEVLLHPVAFAGWIGYLVTALNLLPVGQLDGGHISFALFGKKHKIIGYSIFGIILLLGLLWMGWFVWGLLLLIIGFGHPPPLDELTDLSDKHRITGYISFVIFILTFIPNPFQLGPMG